MKSTWEEIEDEIERLSGLITKNRQALHLIRKSCNHQWIVKYTPETYGGYTIPGDPPGTMGVDWRGPINVPSKVVNKWTRRCSYCGLTQTTEKTKERVTPGAINGCTHKEQIPDFGDNE